MSNNIRMPDRRLVWSSIIGIFFEVGYALAMLGAAVVIAWLTWRWAL